MATKNFSYFYKKISFIFLILNIFGTLTACQVLQTRKESPKEGSAKSSTKDAGKKSETAKSQSPAVLTPSATSVNAGVLTEKNSDKNSDTKTQDNKEDPEELTSEELPPEPTRSEPQKNSEILSKKTDIKLGIILGPGSIRSYTHIGVMQELAKSKLPVKAVTGFEFGAVVGAIYAKTAQPYDMEWQMMKLKEEQFFSKSLLGGSKSTEPEEFKDFFSSIFQNQLLDDLKIPMACSSLNVTKQQIQFIRQGSAAFSLLRCLSLPPMFKPYQQQISAIMDIKSSVDFLKSKGANYIIFIDLLNGHLSENEWSWSLIHQSMMSNVDGIDLIVQVPLQDISLNDFSKRRELIHRGSIAGQSIIQKIYKKFDL